MRRKLGFHRHFTRYSGGHGKVWDYFTHTLAHPAWDASIHLTGDSIHDGNPWHAHGCDIDVHWPPRDADALFLGGMDWQAIPDERHADQPGRPILNLIQHVRHADPEEPLHGFLCRRAIRICVSQPVADAILATGRVNGPVRVIDAAIRLPDRMPVLQARSGIFIGALKQPRLGHLLADALRGAGHQVALADRWQARDDYLAQLAAAKIAVLLPRATEGFYLPALEAMALGCAVVVPDSVGNRAYLVPGCNALVPDMTLDDLLHAVRRLDDAALMQSLVIQGALTAARFDLKGERVAFHALLDEMDELWRSH